LNLIESSKSLRILTLIMLMAMQATMAVGSSHGAAQDKGRILFDVSHGVWSDPDHGKFTISDGYSILAEALREEGFTVDENRVSLSTGLSGAKVLVLVYLERPLAGQESAAVETFVKNGGGLLVLGDCSYNYGSEQYGYLNRVSQKFGILFNSDVIVDYNDSIASHHKKIVIHQFADHEITLGTGEIKYVWGSSLTVSPPAQALGFSDEDSFADRNRNNVADSTEKRGPLPVVAASEFGEGRVVAIGEKRLFNKAQLGDRLVDVGGWDLDTLHFAIKTFHWLAKAQRDVTVVQSGEVVAIVPNQIYSSQKPRVLFTIDLLNKARPVLEAAYHKTYDRIIWEVVGYSTPPDPRAWGASFSRNKIYNRVDTLSDTDANHIETMIHELAHSYDHYREAYAIPPWLDEGLATAFSAIVPAYIGMSEYASRIDQKLAGCGKEYVDRHYNYVLTWNYTLSQERCPTYGFAYYVTRNLVDDYGVQLVPAFFRSLEIERYPFMELQDPPRGRFDLTSYTSMVVEHLVVLAGNERLLQEFKEWHFPISSETESDISRKLGEDPSVEVLKSVNTPAANVGESVRVILEISNIGKSDLLNVEILDSVPLGFAMTNGTLSWTGALARGQSIMLSYAMEGGTAGKYQLPTATAFYSYPSGRLHVARSNPLQYEVIGQTTTSITSLSTAHTEPPLMTETGMTTSSAPADVLPKLLPIIGAAFIILVIVGAFLLRRRRDSIVPER